MNRFARHARRKEFEDHRALSGEILDIVMSASRSSQTFCDIPGKASRS
jgi:hypothetical protein